MLDKICPSVKPDVTLFHSLGQTDFNDVSRPKKFVLFMKWYTVMDTAQYVKCLING